MSAKREWGVYGRVLAMRLEGGESVRGRREPQRRSGREIRNVYRGQTLMLCLSSGQRQSCKSAVVCSVARACRVCAVENLEHL